MKTSLKLIGSLTLICILSGALLAFVHGATAQRIAEVSQMRTAAAAATVLPPHASMGELVEMEYDDIRYSIQPAYDADQQRIGYAIQFATEAGYGGEIRMMLGVDAEGRTTGLAILSGHKETPGLGAKITEEDFLSRFRSQPLSSTNWQIRKDGGIIDEITAATVSSRAVADAIQHAAAAFTSFQTRQKELE